MLSHAPSCDSHWDTFLCSNLCTFFDNIYNIPYFQLVFRLQRKVARAANLATRDLLHKMPLKCRSLQISHVFFQAEIVLCSTFPFRNALSTRETEESQDSEDSKGCSVTELGFFRTCSHGSKSQEAAGLDLGGLPRWQRQDTGILPVCLSEPVQLGGVGVSAITPESNADQLNRTGLQIIRRTVAAR